MMRFLQKYLLNDLKKKMVFLGGPRQSGKTTLAKSVLNTFDSGLYLNWDDPDDRKFLRQRLWNQSQNLIVLDELHKLKGWKNWIKGTFDTQKNIHSFLITGSARLDVYRRGGDSLLGRYHYWRLHPFTLSEMPTGISLEDGFNRLMTVGGFPEPFLDGDEGEARRWRRERNDRVIRDDLRDLEKVKEIQSISILLDLLKSRVSSHIVISNLAQDLEVSPNAVKYWIELLEKMYLIFVIRPYSKNLARSIIKPPKVYFFDNADVENSINNGARFENLVATHLLKKIHFLEDSQGYRFDLHYLRDKDGREVDFALFKEKKLLLLIEVKWSDDSLSQSLKYYTEKLKPEYSIQIIADLKRSYQKDGIHVVSATEYLSKPLDASWTPL